MTAEPDHAFMGLALEQARRAFDAGEIPVGAVVARDGQVIGRGHNAPIATSDPTAHAEVVAIREAAATARNYRLPGAVLYTTVEPCVMCCGAAIHARLARVVYGAADPKGGGARSLYRLLEDPRLNHAVDVEGEVRGEESAALLRRFFEVRRSEHRSR
jgi:tRNA(adenine34) deaminase